MKQYDDQEPLNPMSLIAFMAVLLLLLFYTWLCKMEAEAYNRVTGSRVTTWDAMFLELRVQGEHRKEADQ